MSGGATSSAVNEALVAQAAQPSSAAPTQAAPTAQPSPLLAGVNPFRQAASTQMTMPGFQGIQNPFYVQARPATQAAPMQASTLGDQYKSYSQGYRANLAAAADQRRADALAAQAAYQKQKAEAESAWKAKYDALSAATAPEFGSAAWFAQQNGWTGADGGIAALTRGVK